MKAKKIVSIHQPAYMPWLGWIHKLMVADTFVILDTVQFEKNSFINRNQIVQPDGVKIWLTIPVLTKGKLEQMIKDVKINWTNDWVKKQQKAIELNYHRCPAWNDGVFTMFYRFELLQSITEIFLFSFAYLIAAKMPLTLEKLRRSKLASRYKTPLIHSKSDLVLEICLREKADIYFSGALGKGYLDEKKFTDVGIEIVYQDYQHPMYKQHQLKDNREFVSHLSVIDLLFNCGRESLDVLMEGNVTKADIRKEVADRSRTKKIEAGIRRTIEFVEGLNG